MVILILIFIFLEENDLKLNSYTYTASFRYENACKSLHRISLKIILNELHNKTVSPPRAYAPNYRLFQLAFFRTVLFIAIILKLILVLISFLNMLLCHVNIDGNVNSKYLRIFMQIFYLTF